MASTTIGITMVARMASTNPLVKIAWAICSIWITSRAGRPWGRCTLVPPWPAPTPTPFCAVALKPVIRWARVAGGSAVVRALAWLTSATDSLFCSSAPTAAVPMTEPTCRTVLIMPEAAPAIWARCRRMAIVVIGAKVQPIPTPATISVGRKSCQVEWVGAIAAVKPKPMANSIRPENRMYLPPIRSVIRPAAGATNMEMIDAGAMVRPALSAEKPSADCR